VHISSWNGVQFAVGQLGAVRNTPDFMQFIGCGLTARRGQSPVVSCYARDTNANTASCQSSDPGLIQALSAIGPDSLIQFSGDASGCTAITVYVDSAYVPKQP
jgi:hypothetical protein